MFKIYARIDNGVYVEFIAPADPYDTEAPDWEEGEPSRIGTERPIEVRFPAEIVATMVDITGMDPMPQPGWTYNDGLFAGPATPVIDYTAINSAFLQQLSMQASQSMTPYFLALNLGNATDEETLKAKEWQMYYRDLQVVDITEESPAWPVPPT
ncbi:tail fiber assembly protein [Pseudomonas vancouverensis]|uniref:Uncharacterized protein n=1 Tax=Pseudomonas vancouverensis TaxID=95300 RepID=A0A1H2MV73_PSEVA|nr:tail fiber assembly protein [Pseudomonas vancouverensis]KAB0489679.1 tail fiber assembly protein [Pseudomonas vancouverensis]TDB67175.1 hypothetical protein EIY72_03765 [Pseudomonas vancouverensis]SDU97129.1 virus tail fibre assembly protein, lambda gpK [Pseudomonas vancouverensis]